MLRLLAGESVVDFNDDKMMNIEAIALKKATGLSFVELYEGIREMDAEALTALVWLARRRNGEPALKYSDVEFDLSDVIDSFEVLDEDGNPLPPPAEGGPGNSPAPDGAEETSNVA